VKHILFVCTHNAGRSQMAQAFWRKHAPSDVRAESAGQEPAKAPWPEVVQAMAEVGIDISRERPKKLDLELQLRADWAITLGCGGACPYVPTRVDDWDLPDPHGQPIEVVREIRDDVERRVQEFIATRLDDIRQDRTAHQLRLVRMLPDLDREFADTHPADEIRACADAILERYDEAPVRSMVQTIAYRETRECLREDRCRELVEIGAG
jgi:arsenate reductase (thioredoxin)